MRASKVAVLTVAILLATPALADQPVIVPWTVQAAMADVVALAGVTVPANPCAAEPLTVYEVVEVFDGPADAARPAPPASVRVVGTTARECVGGRYLGPVDRVGQRRVIGLRHHGADWRVVLGMSVDRMDEMRRIARQIPAWSKPVGGLRARIVPLAFDPPTGDRAASRDDRRRMALVVQNVSGRRFRLDATFPPADRPFYLDLHVTRGNGTPIPMERVPSLDAAAIQTFVETHPRSWIQSLDDGEATYLHLGRYDTGEMGWGYRGAFRFRFVPLSEPGVYQITATIHDLLRDRVLETAPLVVTLD